MGENTNHTIEPAFQGNREMLTASEVAKIFNCSTKMIYKLRRTILPARYKLFEGVKGLRWSRADIDAYVKSVELAGLPEPESIRKPFIRAQSPYR